MMTEIQGKPAVILMADDNPDDIVLVKEALKDCRCEVDFRHVEDGEGAMEYLMGRGRYRNREISPRPDLVLLDLKMPKKDGLETLREIRTTREIHEIPVVVLTNSREHDLITCIYGLGGSSFIRKPVVYEDMVRAMDALCRYWFGTVTLPGQEVPAAPKSCTIGVEPLQIERN
jgi:CheY-like chemotaxis protein